MFHHVLSNIYRALRCLISLLRRGTRPRSMPRRPLQRRLRALRGCLITFRAVASNRQIKALASVIIFVLVKCSHHKHPKYLGREFNHGHCLCHNFLPATALILLWISSDTQTPKGELKNKQGVAAFFFRPTLRCPDIGYRVFDIVSQIIKPPSQLHWFPCLFVCSWIIDNWRFSFVRSLRRKTTGFFC